jgi:hypothetical protein
VLVLASLPGRPCERHRIRSPMSHTLSPAQEMAIRAAMKLFIDEDHARGIPTDQRFSCDACRHSRPTAGAIRYAGCRLCNRCAIAYELASTCGLVANPEEYIAHKRQVVAGEEPRGERHAGQRQERAEGQRWHETTTEQERQGQAAMSAAGAAWHAVAGARPAAVL